MSTTAKIPKSALMTADSIRRALNAMCMRPWTVAQSLVVPRGE